MCYFTRRNVLREVARCNRAKFLTAEVADEPGRFNKQKTPFSGRPRKGGFHGAELKQWIPLIQRNFAAAITCAWSVDKGGCGCGARSNVGPESMDNTELAIPDYKRFVPINSHDNVRVGIADWNSSLNDLDFGFPIHGNFPRNYLHKLLLKTNYFCTLFNTL